VALVGKRYKRAERLVNLFENAVGSVKVVGCDVFPDFVEVSVGSRVEGKSGHCYERLDL
jgi:hypothetical protein